LPCPVFCCAQFGWDACIRPEPGASPGRAPTAIQLEALAGEYTDPHEPDTPLSFHVQNGKLIVESEDIVPAELKPLSAVEFSLSGLEEHLPFHAR
jgi:hypothetical protein